jgi:hypothetical protein
MRSSKIRVGSVVGHNLETYNWRKLRGEHGYHTICANQIALALPTPYCARARIRYVGFRRHTVRDGRVKHDELIGNVYLEDLREFKESALGHAILQS